MVFALIAGSVPWPSGSTGMVAGCCCGATGAATRTTVPPDEGEPHARVASTRHGLGARGVLLRPRRRLRWLTRWTRRKPSPALRFQPLEGPHSRPWTTTVARC
jgi:hypothetical protein